MKEQPKEIKNNYSGLDELPSSEQLRNSTIIAIIASVVILVTIVLPAEYAIDPTGIGNLLGLQRMGEIKMQLEREAQQESQSSSSQSFSTVSSSRSSVSASSSTSSTSQNEDEMTINLAPDASAEVKLQMLKDAKVNYTWTVDKGTTNSSLHTALTGTTHVYREGREETSDSGTLTAISDGSHGWFFRNRSGVEIKITIKVTGQFSSFTKL